MSAAVERLFEYLLATAPLSHQGRLVGRSSSLAHALFKRAYPASLISRRSTPNRPAVSQAGGGGSHAFALGDTSAGILMQLANQRMPCVSERAQNPKYLRLEL